MIVLSGVARAFLQPARQALSAELVPRSLYSNAITWRTGAWQLAAVIGPAIGGLATLGVVAAVAWLVPSLRRMGRMMPDETEAATAAGGWPPLSDTAAERACSPVH